MPLFAGCEGVENESGCSKEQLFKFIIDNLKYPEVAEKNGTEGMVFVKFTVGKNGLVQNTKIEKSLSPACDAEVLRVLEAMPKWTPGIKNDIPVDVELTLPFKFQLPDEEKNKQV